MPSHYRGFYKACGKSMWDMNKVELVENGVKFLDWDKRKAEQQSKEVIQTYLKEHLFRIGEKSVEDVVLSVKDWKKED